MEKQNYTRKIMLVLKDKAVMYSSELIRELNQYEEIESHQLVYDALAILARANKITMEQGMIYLNDVRWQ